MEEDELKDKHNTKRPKVDKLEDSKKYSAILNSSCDNITSDVNSRKEKSSDLNNTVDEHYFKCYADLSIHKLMIEDFSRTHTYRKAILSNYNLFYKKTVADIGAGTGILSAFCVQAGAKKVYAIEASSIAEEAKHVVAANNMDDRIVVIEGKAEEIKLPEKVDIIVSEWMGYMLLYESMLPSVLYMRDNWLKWDGVLFPMKAKIFLAPLSDPEEYEDRVESWKQVYDAYKVDTSVLAISAAKQLQSFVQVKKIEPTSVQSHACCVVDFDLANINSESLECVKGNFSCSCFGHSTIHGFVVWFTVEFPNEIVLSTSPYENETHWEQSVLYVPPFNVVQDTMLKGVLTIKPHKRFHRFLNVLLEYSVDGGQEQLFSYTMSD